MSVRQQYRREYGKGLPHKKPIASETDARKMNSSARLGGLKEAPASIGGEYFTCRKQDITENPPIYRKAGTKRRSQDKVMFKISGNGYHF